MVAEYNIYKNQMLYILLMSNWNLNYKHATTAWRKWGGREEKEWRKEEE